MVLTDEQLVAMAADAVRAEQAGHPVPGIIDGLRMVASQRAALEREQLAAATKSLVGTVTTVGLEVLRAVFLLVRA